jgi:hypothetical protein
VPDQRDRCAAENSLKANVRASFGAFVAKLDMSTFTPFLWVLTDRQVPDQIFVVAILGEEHFRAISLPETMATLPSLVELKFLARVVTSHFKRSGGELPHFGKIRGYLYLRTPDQRWTLDITGKVIDRHGEEIAKGNYSLTLKNKPNADVAPLFRKHLRRSSQKN